MKFSYYPGCTALSTSTEYTLSYLEVLSVLGVELEEIEGWNCCGAAAARNLNYMLSISLPARNIAIAQEKGLPLVIPCAGCFRNLKRAHHVLQNDPDVKKTVESLIGFKFMGGLEMRALLDVVVKDVGLERIAERVRQPLGGLKVVSYYGCALVRPPKITHLDDPENPQCLDNLMETLGTIPLDWSHKTECCGADLTFTRINIVNRLVGEIMAEAREVGAEAIVTPCGLCHINLEIRRSSGMRSMPVFYYTELMGLAFGLEECPQWWKRHFINPSKLLEEKGLALPEG
ncbi:MAG: heterodisulfide reductase subunit B [Proteobacteria bacterium]|nr:heterodisulfide reductase subunit B [Pseudomonadota bacterium]